MTYIDRLRRDPQWAKEALCATLAAAERRWRRRLKPRRGTLWFRPLLEVREAFVQAIATLKNLEMEDSDVDAYITQAIDRHIFSLLAGQPPSPPRRRLQGAKRRGRNRITSDFSYSGHDSLYDNDQQPSGVDPAESWDNHDLDDADLLLAHLDDCSAQFEAVVSQIKHPTHKRALTMLRDGKRLSTIRRATGLRGPEMRAVYERWCLVLGYVVPPTLRAAG